MLQASLCRRIKLETKNKVRYGMPLSIGLTFSCRPFDRMSSQRQFRSAQVSSLFSRSLRGLPPLHRHCGQCQKLMVLSQAPPRKVRTVRVNPYLYTCRILVNIHWRFVAEHGRWSMICLLAIKQSRNTGLSNTLVLEG